MKKEMKEIQTYQYDGEGLQVSYSNENWIVGVKNYKPASDIRFMDALERHLLTDELFVPVTAGSQLVSLKGGTEVAAETPTEGIAVEHMEVGHFYCVPQGVWHNVVMQKGGKCILIERPGTGVDNSEFKKLTPEELKTLRTLAASRQE